MKKNRERKTVPGKAVQNSQIGKWVAQLVACLLTTAALWVLIQTSVKNTKVSDISKGVTNILQPGQNSYIRVLAFVYTCTNTKCELRANFKHNISQCVLYLQYIFLNQNAFLTLKMKLYECLIRAFADTRGLQRDVVYLDWPIAPSFISPNGGEGVGGGGCGVSANENSCTQEPK